MQVRLHGEVCAGQPAGRRLVEGGSLSKSGGAGEAQGGVGLETLGPDPPPRGRTWKDSSVPLSAQGSSAAPTMFNFSTNG